MNAATNTEPAVALSPIDEAAMDLAEAKREEEEARAHRIRCEEAIIALVGVKQEGSTTHKTDLFKITTTGKLTRSLDVPAWTTIAPGLPADVRDRVVNWKPELSLTAIRVVEASNPALYAVIAQAVTVKPAKAAVTVERVEH
jgi:hypothetical protein